MTPRFKKDWDRRPAEEYREEQVARLREFLRRQVLPFSPHYQRVFREAGVDPAALRSMDDVARIPFTSKEDIAPTREDPQRSRGIVLQPTAQLLREHLTLGKKVMLGLEKWTRGEEAMRAGLAREYRPVSVFFTTGRSSLPTAFVLTAFDIAVLEEVGRRIIEVAGIDNQDDRLVSLFPYAPHLAFWQVYYAGLGGSVFTLNTGGGKVMGTDGILQSITKIRPAFIVGIPGYIYHVLREAHARELDLGFLKGIALGGDQVTPGYRGRVRELLELMGAKKPRIQSVFGFTEARKCWAECVGEAAGGFHTYPDLELIEIVDPETGRAVEEGRTGELVYTGLTGRGSCVIRYRTGDLIVGGMTHAQCPHCGRTVPRISSQVERVSNMKSFQLSKVKGTLVNLNVFKDELESDSRVEEWQLVIKKRNDDPFDIDELHLNVSLSPEVPLLEHDVVAGAIERRLFAVSEVNLNTIRVLPLKQLLDLLGMETQLKEKRIVDLRTTAASPARPEEPGRR